jgi:hypothetical protein
LSVVFFEQLIKSIPAIANKICVLIYWLMFGFNDSDVHCYGP